MEDDSVRTSVQEMEHKKRLSIDTLAQFSCKRASNNAQQSAGRKILRLLQVAIQKKHAGTKKRAQVEMADARKKDEEERMMKEIVEEEDQHIEQPQLFGDVFHDQMVATMFQPLKEAGTRLLHALPKERLDNLLNDVQCSTSPVAEAIRAQLLAHEHARVLEEDQQQHDDQLLEDILLEGELLLRLLPDHSAQRLLQILDYTPRTDNVSGDALHSCNQNPVVTVLRAHSHLVEEDALFQADALLAGTTLASTVVDEVMGSHDNYVDGLLEEGENLLSPMNLFPDSGAKGVVQRPHVMLQLGGVARYDECREQEEEQVEARVRPSTACYRATLEAGGQDIMQMLKESERLLGALPSPHARSLLYVLEHSYTPLSGALRTLCNRHGVANVANFDSALATPANLTAATVVAGREESCSGDAADTLGRPVVEDGLSRFQKLQSLHVESFKHDGKTMEEEVREMEQSLDTEESDEPVHVETHAVVAACDDDTPPVAHAVVTTAESSVSVAEPEKEQMSPSSAEEDGREREEDEKEKRQLLGEEEPDAGKENAKTLAERSRISMTVVRTGVEVAEKAMQHAVGQIDVQTQMPSRPTSVQLEAGWCVIRKEEIQFATEADAHQIFCETIAFLVRGVEDQDAMEKQIEQGERHNLRDVVSAKTQRQDATFVAAYDAKKAEEGRLGTERLAAEEREWLWENEREALKAMIASKDQEVLELRSYLNKLPVVKVTHTVDHITGRLVDDPRYEYSRIPFEEEMATHLQEEAERARHLANEAKAEADRARRVVAEEAFLLEAAKAEVRLEAYRLQQRLEVERQRAERDRATATKLDARRGAELELKEGWVNVKREGLGGGLQRRLYVLRSTAILSFADDTRNGGCLNAQGLECIHRFCAGEKNTLEIHLQEGNTIVLHLGGLDARNAWLVAFETTLKRFRSTYVAQPTLPPLRSEVDNEVMKDSWDVAVEEKLRREVEARRDAVTQARMQQQRADKLLDVARVEHQRLDRELNLRTRYPAISGNFLNSLPVPEERDQVKMGGGGRGGGAVRGGVTVIDMENAIDAANKLSKEQYAKDIKQVQDTWREKVKETEKKVLALDKELVEYKQISSNDHALDAAHILITGHTAKDDADAAAANFNGTIYSDGMMVLPPEWEQMGVTTALGDKTRPLTAWSESQVHVFVENGQAVLMQGMNTTVFGCCMEGGGREGDDSVGVALKAALV